MKMFYLFLSFMILFSSCKPGFQGETAPTASPQDTPVVCDATEILINNVCVLSNQTRACVVSNGVGSQSTTDGGNTWGSCLVISCDSGFSNYSNNCVVSSQSRSCLISNGLGTQSTADGGNTWGSCLVVSCNSNYSQNGNNCELSNQSRACSIANGSGLEITTDGGNTWGSCQVSSCNTNYTQVGNACELSFQTRACYKENGVGYESTTNGGILWTNCLVSSCNSGYSNVNEDCVSSNQSRMCSIANGYGSQSSTDGGVTWGTCSVVSCDVGYFQSGNTCQPTTQTRSCSITNGTGIETSTDGGLTWGTCTVSSCNTGFVQSGNFCVELCQTSGMGVNHGGTGTQSDPYLICNTDQYNRLCLDIDENIICSSGSKTYYKLMSDLTFNPSTNSYLYAMTVGEGERVSNSEIDLNNKTLTINNVNYKVPFAYEQVKLKDVLFKNGKIIGNPFYAGTPYAPEVMTKATNITFENIHLLSRFLTSDENDLSGFVFKNSRIDIPLKDWVYPVLEFFESKNNTLTLFENTLININNNSSCFTNGIITSYINHGMYSYCFEDGTVAYKSPMNVVSFYANNTTTDFQRLFISTATSPIKFTKTIISVNNSEHTDWGYGTSGNLSGSSSFNMDLMAPQVLIENPNDLIFVFNNKTASDWNTVLNARVIQIAPDTWDASANLTNFNSANGYFPSLATWFTITKPTSPTCPTTGYCHIKILPRSVLTANNRWYIQGLQTNNQIVFDGEEYYKNISPLNATNYGELVNNHQLFSLFMGSVYMSDISLGVRIVGSAGTFSVQGTSTNTRPYSFSFTNINRYFNINLSNNTTMPARYLHTLAYKLNLPKGSLELPLRVRDTEPLDMVRLTEALHFRYWSSNNATDSLVNAHIVYKPIYPTMDVFQDSPVIFSNPSSESLAPLFYSGKVKIISVDDFKNQSYMESLGFQYNSNWLKQDSASSLPYIVNPWE